MSVNDDTEEHTKRWDGLQTRMPPPIQKQAIFMEKTLGVLILSFLN